MVESTLGIYQEINDTSAILPFLVLINLFMNSVTQNKNYRNFCHLVYTLNAVSIIVQSRGSLCSLYVCGIYFHWKIIFQAY